MLIFNYGDSAEFRIDELDLGAVPSISTKVNILTSPTTVGAPIVWRMFYALA